MTSALAAFLYSHLWLVIFAAVIVIPSLSYDREQTRRFHEQNEKRRRAYREKWEKPRGA